MQIPRFLILGLISLLPACGGDASKHARANRFPTVPKGMGFPLRIDLPSGDVCELVTAPQRILIANTYLVDVVTALVGAERILALPEQSLTWSRLVEIDEGFRDKASFREIGAELVLEFGPDLLLCSDTNVALGRGKFAGKTIPRLTLPQPREFDELRLVMQLLVRALGVEDAGVALLSKFDTDLEELHAHTARRNGLDALVYSNLGGGGWSVGKETLIDAVIELLGMRNPVAAAGRTGHVQLTLEDLITFDPDVIIIQSRAGESSYDSEAVLRGEPRLQGMLAIRADRIVRLHPRLFSTGSQEILVAARQIAEQVDRQFGLKGAGR